MEACCARWRSCPEGGSSVLAVSGVVRSLGVGGRASTLIHYGIGLIVGVLAWAAGSVAAAWIVAVYAG